MGGASKPVHIGVRPSRRPPQIGSSSVAQHHCEGNVGDSDKATKGGSSPFNAQKRPSCALILGARCSADKDCVSPAGLGRLAGGDRITPDTTGYSSLLQFRRRSARCP
jgi:hypothetical protein